MRIIPFGTMSMCVVPDFEAIHVTELPPDVSQNANFCIAELVQEIVIQVGAGNPDHVTGTVGHERIPLCAFRRAIDIVQRQRIHWPVIHRDELVSSNRHVIAAHELTIRKINKLDKLKHMDLPGLAEGQRRRLPALRF